MGEGALPGEPLGTKGWVAAVGAKGKEPHQTTPDSRKEDHLQILKKKKKKKKGVSYCIVGNFYNGSCFRLLCLVS